MKKNQINYKSSGVDIDKANEAKKEMAIILEAGKNNARILNKVGAFASLIDGNFPQLRHPVLVMKTEEPGSKQKLAFQYGKIESICFDMINHLINDIIVMGASPIAVQDAIICGKLEKEVISKLVASLSKACTLQGCSLIGGETSEQPGVLKEGEYILTSSIIGVVDKNFIIDGSKITIEDDIIAISSNGPHTNGYSLIRALINDDPSILKAMIEGESFLELIMKPHVCYYNALKEILTWEGLHGLAHITGGGIKENLNRILPNSINALINLNSISVLPVFKFIKQQAELEERELLRTFNCGVGMIVVCNKKITKNIIKHIGAKNLHAYIIGETILGNKEVEYKGSLSL